MCFSSLLTASVIMPLALLAGCSGSSSPGNSSSGTSSSGTSSSGSAAGTAIGTNQGQVPARIPSRPATAAVSLAETGSTLLYPLFGAWASAYHQQFPSVSFTTAATGSGTGIADASSGKASIGASDAFLSSGNLVQNPGLLNIPLAIGAQQINYNLPHLGRGVHIKLNGAVLAAMYEGQVTTWNNPAIARLNPGVSLPGIRVVPLHRAESSGDTFLFSSYLSTGDPHWNSAIGYGTTVAWPHVAGAPAEKGNSGMVTGCAATPGCVAYVGIAYLTQALNAGLGEAELQNAAGQFTLPNGASLRAAVAGFVPATPANETISMVNGPARAGYPIVNYEYAIVADRQPSAARARDLQAFLHWVITAGNSARYLNQVRFEPLPGPVVSLADAQIASIR
jgi:phosphate transport system substrate-binding protein